MVSQTVAQQKGQSELNKIYGHLAVVKQDPTLNEFCESNFVKACEYVQDWMKTDRRHPVQSYFRTCMINDGHAELPWPGQQ